MFRHFIFRQSSDHKLYVVGGSYKTVFPPRAVTLYMDSKGTAPLILNLGTG
jgi:hypothetical protein